MRHEHAHLLKKFRIYLRAVVRQLCEAAKAFGHGIVLNDEDETWMEAGLQNLFHHGIREHMDTAPLGLESSWEAPGSWEVERLTAVP